MLSHFRASSGNAAGLAVAFGLTATPAPADDCRITCTDFEDGVPHVDLMTCPANRPDDETGFRRLAFDGKSATVFVFHYGADDACLADVKHRPVRDFLTG